jgi:AcrR family transcriptional regulator
LSEERLSHEAREKQLRLAISRIQRKRSRTNENVLTIAAVGREAGVSTALIHNHHPNIAELVRDAQGRSSRAQRDAKHGELKSEREKNRVLRAEADELRHQVASLASINEVLVIELRELKARMADGKVVELGKKR